MVIEESLRQRITELFRRADEHNNRGEYSDIPNVTNNILHIILQSVEIRPQSRELPVERLSARLTFSLSHDKSPLR